MTEPAAAPIVPSTSDRVVEARKAHARGWAMTPLRGKRPILDGWAQAPKPDLATVEAWAREGNLGLRTGEVSGVFAVDDDTTDGSGTAPFNLPKTPTVITSGGKRHFYFRYPADGIRNSASKLAPNVDIRGEGGQVVFPGSLHPDTGAPYRWAPGLSPEEVELAEPPSALLDLLRTPRKGSSPPPAPPPPRRSSTPGSAPRRKRRTSIACLARPQLLVAASAVSNAAEGTRNETLNKWAFVMGGYIGAGLIERAFVEEVLGTAAAECGLEDTEIEPTLRSGIEAGMENPITPRRAKRKVRNVGQMARPGTSPTSSSPAADIDSSEPLDSNGSGSLPPEGEQARSGSPAARRRPRIVIHDGGLPDCVTKGEQALLDDHDGDPIYQRGSLLVRAVRVPVPTVRRGFRGAQGALLLRPVTLPYLIERFTIAAEWVRVRAVGNEIVEENVDCPTIVAQTYLAREGHWKAPVLLGVIEAPTLRPDGSILATPGYDPETCLLFDPGSTQFEPIPEEPTLEDARAALCELLEILKGFAWVAPSDRAAALAAILTALIRRSIRTAPLSGFRAPTMASGKSLLADIVSMIATGRVCSVMSQGKDEDEERKRILAILIEGEPVACIDNIERPLGGPDLCSVLTQEYYKGRLLGKSEMVQAPTAITLLATGNNLVFTGDLVTRVVPCDLDPRCERPEERRFDVNLHEYVPAHRGRLVRAGLTVLRAYHFAGRPSQGLSVFGRFEEWSDWVRSALVWSGEADPCEGRKRLSESDPVSRQLRAMLSSWSSVFGRRVVTVAEVIRAAHDCGEDAAHDLWDALVEAACGQDGKPNARRLGKWLSSYERRAVDGLRIERAGDRQGVALWQVVQVGEGDGSVGLVGLVGLADPTPRTPERAPACAHTDQEPGGTNPRNPPNLPSGEGGDDNTGSPPVHESLPASLSTLPGSPGPSLPCRLCRGMRWWSLRGRWNWICERCHPPGVPLEQVEFWDQSEDGHIGEELRDG
ncbi:MAG: bifunctional DNA primase/polymerase [Planctomycetota bacterium]